MFAQGVMLKMLKLDIDPERDKLTGQVLINAQTGQVKSWYGACPVTRLIRSWPQST
jgi:hypothetical protein